MLLQIPVSSFEVADIRRKTADSFKWLLETPWDAVSQHREIEIIPYEILWQIVMRSIDKPYTAGYSKTIDRLAGQTSPKPPADPNTPPAGTVGLSFH